MARAKPAPGAEHLSVGALSQRCARLLRQASSSEGGIARPQPRSAHLIALLALALGGCATTSPLGPAESLLATRAGCVPEVRAATAPDGVPIVYRVWVPAAPQSSRAVLVIPGIGYHSAPYAVVADALTADGHAVAAVDLRGHGRSGGIRGTVPTPEQVVGDLDAVIACVRLELAPERVYILGESMGGLVALHYVATTGTSIDGVVFVAPAIRVASAQIASPETVLVLGTFLFARDAPVVNLVGARLDESTADAAFKEARRNDRLAIDRLSVNYLRGLGRLMEGWREKAARIRAPSLVLHGTADAVLDPRGSEALHAALGASTKALVLVPDAHHTLFWDAETPRVFAEIRRFVGTLP